MELMRANTAILTAPALPMFSKFRSCRMNLWSTPARSLYCTMRSNHITFYTRHNITSRQRIAQ